MVAAELLQEALGPVVQGAGPAHALEEDKHTLVIATSTKATPETVEAIKAANAKGAVTIGLSGYADSLTAQSANYYITYYHAVLDLSRF